MTILKIHLVMLGLGLFVYLFVAGVLRNRKSYSRRIRRQWWLGAIAGIIVAISPFTRFWRSPPNNTDLLIQALVFSAIGLLALLTFALLSRARGGDQNRSYKSRTSRASERSKKPSPTMAAGLGGAGIVAGLSPIIINADRQSADDDQLSAVTLDKSGSPAPAFPDSSIATTVEAEAGDNDRIHPDTSVTQERSKPGSEVSFAEHTDEANAEAGIPETGLSVSADAMSTATNDIVDEQENATELSAASASNDKQLTTEQEQTHKSHLDDISSAVALHSGNAGTQQVDKAFSEANAANDTEANSALFDTPVNESLSEDDTLNVSADTEELQLSPIDAPIQQTTPDESVTDNLDLSETEQLFAEMRQQNVEVELPDEEELRRANAAASIEELDLDNQLVSDDRANSKESTNTKAVGRNEDDQIEEAEVVAIDDRSTDFGNDLTGEYAHPNTELGMAKSYQATTEDEEIVIPQTLDEAIIAAKVGAVSLQTQVSTLEKSIDDLTAMRDATVTAAKASQQQQLISIEHKDELIESGEKARHAAEAVIAAQSDLINKAKLQQVQITRLLQQERERLHTLESEVARSRKMARSAAQLARRAAVAQQEVKVLAHREKRARLKSQESTRKAVDIARNAISALAAEERRRGVTRH